MVQMLLNNNTEHLVKNTSKITGFVGSSKVPPKLKPKEIKRLKCSGKEIIRHTEITYTTGDQVKIIDGPFNNFNGNISEVKLEKNTQSFLVSFHHIIKLT